VIYTCPVCGREMYLAILGLPQSGRLIDCYYCRVCGKIKFENEREEEGHDKQATNSGFAGKEA
jgi:DNA-directed RNA polymerase subunit RPC12/RpoP